MKDTHITHIVFENNAAGSCWIVEIPQDEYWTYQELGGSYADSIFEGSKEECIKYLEQYEKDSTFYAVFCDRECDGYYRKMNCNSGTYNENKFSKFDDHCKNFDTEEEAIQYIEKYL